MVGPLACGLTYLSMVLVGSVNVHVGTCVHMGVFLCRDMCARVGDRVLLQMCMLKLPGFILGHGGHVLGKWE